MIKLRSSLLQLKIFIITIPCYSKWLIHPNTVTISKSNDIQGRQLHRIRMYSGKGFSYLIHKFPRVIILAHPEQILFLNHLNPWLKITFSLHQSRSIILISHSCAWGLVLFLRILASLCEFARK